MRPELISVLKNSQYSIVREVAGADPVAVFRWSILRAFFRAVSAFHGAAIKYTKRKGKGYWVSSEGALSFWLCIFDYVWLGSCYRCLQVCMTSNYEYTVNLLFMQICFLQLNICFFYQQINKQIKRQTNNDIVQYVTYCYYSCLLLLFLLMDYLER